MLANDEERYRAESAPGKGFPDDTHFKRVAIDIAGPINLPSEAEYTFILTLVDHATNNAGAGCTAGVDTFCSVRAALRMNHTRPYAYLEGIMDKRDPEAKCVVKLLTYRDGSTPPCS
ncbi:hypothetical protein PoB_003783300 [Plakobranchus ocellatus]|uniref:Uncharacterized protein n=1 Tax=Plakobranchus ocellatus TaxID=259542 RepID=A0AAV4AWW4_9GAST|nr:hypothetical protein PoB_003783300 [Plakobranchus ocellatus]